MSKKIAYITDIHLNEGFPTEIGVDTETNWNTILKDVQSKGINEIIFGGDIGSKEAHPLFFNSLKDFRLNLVLGNHDNFSEVNKHFRNKSQLEHEELCYSYEEGYFKFIYLDSSSGTLSRDQFGWFRKELKTNKKINLFIHHPILPINTFPDKDFYLRGREKIKEELHKLEIEINIFCGHYHTSDKITDRNIIQRATLAGSYQIKKEMGKVETINDIFGYRIVKLKEDEVVTEVVLLS